MLKHIWEIHVIIEALLPASVGGGHILCGNVHVGVAICIRLGRVMETAQECLPSIHVHVHCTFVCIEQELVCSY